MKRILSILLALSMALSAMTAVAFADGETAATATKTNTKTYELKGGTVNGNTLTTKDNGLKITKGNDDVFSADEGYVLWNGYNHKDNTGNTLQLQISGFKFATGRKYLFKFDMKNGTPSNAGDNGSTGNDKNAIIRIDTRLRESTAYDMVTKKNFNCYYHVDGKLQEDNYGYGSANGMTIKPEERKTWSSSFNLTNVEGKSSNNPDGVCYDSAYVPYGNNVINFFLWTNSKAEGLKPYLYSVSIEETAPYHKITAEETNGTGTILITSETLNFGKNNDKAKLTSSGAEVEDLMDATFDITAPDDKVIDTVKYTPAGGNEKDLSAEVAGKSSGSVSVSLIKADGELSVTYKANATEASVKSDKFITQNSFTYTPESGTAVTGSGNSIIAYATITTGGKAITACGVELTKGDVTITLPAKAVPTGFKYAIRAFGSGITAGKYTMKPYIVVEGKTVYGTSSEVEVK